MPAKYQFFKNPQSPQQKEEDEGVLHARIVEGQTLRFEKLCELIADRSTFKVGEVQGVMTLFKEELIRSLKEGDPVEIEGVGTFYATATCAPIHDPKEIRAESIHFSRIVFRACKELKREMSLMRFERAADYRKPNVYSPEQRRLRILRYLEKNREISSAWCMGLNQCSRYVAQADLKFLKEEGALVCLGGPRVAVYVLPDKAKTE